MKRLHCLIAAALTALLLLSTVACTGTTPPVETKPETTPATDASTVESDAPTSPAETNDQTLPAPAESDTAAPAESETQAPDPDPTPEGYRPAQEVKVISMNLDANADTATERAKRMLPMLLEFEPDSIGVQEARGPWISMLKHFLTKDGTYARIGVDAGGQPDATQGYFATYIFYRADKYTVIDSGTFWMSRTPDVPSIYDSTVDCNRTCTWAVLEDKTTGFRYVHMNTHLDWMNMQVNLVQVSMIREQIERFEAMGYPVFATGDYNCDEGTASYEEMLKSDITADSKHVAEKTMDLGTYPDYGRYDVTKTKPIDYVFVTKAHMTVHEYKVIDEKPGGEYVSDHNGLLVHATVNAMPIREKSDGIPAFAANAAIKAEFEGKDAAIVTIPQAVDRNGVPAASYAVEITDKDGAKLLEATVSGRLFLPVPPETVSVCAEKLVSGKTYTVRVTPKALLGQTGEALTSEFTFKANEVIVTPEEMGKADIFDLAIQDGAPVDVSPNGMSFEKIGSVTVGDHALSFNGGGNYKVPDFKNHYGKLENGFTIELFFATGDDVTTYTNPVANFHAGGFGYAVDGGRLCFDVRLGGVYVGTAAPIEPNTTYHSVAVYDHEAGNLSLYLNGKLVDTASGKGMTHPTDPGAMYLCIGADSDASGQGEYPFTGDVFHVRLYDSVASAGQALWLYQQVVE